MLLMRYEKENLRQKKRSKMLTSMTSWTMISTTLVTCFKRYLCPDINYHDGNHATLKLQAGKKSKSSLMEEASKERRGKNKIFAHIQKEIETKEHNKPKINENDQVLSSIPTRVVILHRFGHSGRGDFSTKFIVAD